MSVSSVPNCLSVRYLNSKCGSSTPCSGSFKKRVACMINVSTTTSFMGDFITDKLQEQDVSFGQSSDSPIFYQSSSSNNETIYKKKADKIRIDNLSTNSLNESMKVDNNTTSSNTSDYLLSIKSNPINSTVISSSTMTDTFGYLFALDQSNKTNKSLEEIPQGLTVPFANDFSQRFHTNILLSASSKPTKKVNFKSQLTKGCGDVISKDKSKITKPILNRQVISFVYPTKASEKAKSKPEKNEGDVGKNKITDVKITLDTEKIQLNNEKAKVISDNNKTSKEFTKLTSVVSEKANLFEEIELKNEHYLPLTAEGDTVDNHSEMIKVYPRFVSSHPTQLQLFTHVHTTDSIPSPSYSYVTHDLTKNRYILPAEKIKSQKIFSQLHHKFPKVKSMSKKCKTQSEIQNHSIETMKFFHSTLALKEF